MTEVRLGISMRADSAALQEGLAKVAVALKRATKRQLAESLARAGAVLQRQSLRLGRQMVAALRDKKAGKRRGQ